jgi:integrase
VREFAKHGVKLVSITQELGDDPAQVMMRQVIALFDEYQSKENAKHVRLLPRQHDLAGRNLALRRGLPLLFVQQPSPEGPDGLPRPVHAHGQARPSGHAAHGRAALEPERLITLLSSLAGRRAEKAAAVDRRLAALVRDLLRLILMTGCRRAEMTEASWPEIDLDAKTFTIPPERFKSDRTHVVPLSDVAVAMFDQLPRFTSGDRVADGYVFTTTSGKKAVDGFS